jgi:hypothetical protein
MVEVFAVFFAMELLTILNRCHRFRGFVYRHARGPREIPGSLARLVGRLQMAPHPLLQFGTIPLYPPPHGGMVGLQTTFLK